MLAAPRLAAQCPDGSAPPCRPRPATGPVLNSIAVLYFENSSQDTSDAYLADGLTEELINTLGRNTHLVVKPQYSVRRYRRTQTTDPITMARALNVSHLLTGSVRRWGVNRVRVTVELIQARTGTRIWGESYDIATTDPLEIQQQIATAVTVRLVGQLSGAERASLAQFPTKSREAYDHFLRGLYYMGPRDRVGLLRALQEFEAAARIDPSFARAHARIALVCGILLFQGQDSVTARGLLAQGITAVDRSLQLDSTNSDTWLARGRLIDMQRGALDDVLTSYKRAIALDSNNADAHHFYGILLLHNQADWTGALPALRRAATLDPGRLNTLNSLGIAEFAGRNVPAALRWWDSVVALHPMTSAPALHMALVNRASVRLVMLSDTVGSPQDAAELTRLGDERRSHGIMALLALRRGDSAAARTELDLLWRTSNFPKNGCDPLGAVVLVAMKERERALSCIEGADPATMQPWWFAYFHLPFFDPIRDELRFRTAIERLRSAQRQTHVPEN